MTELEQIANDEARHAHRDLIQRLTERAERAEEVLRYYRDQMCEGFCTDLKSQSEYGESMDFHCAGCKARATLAQLDAEPAMRCAECDCDNPPHGCNWIAPGPLAEPAGVSEPAHREVWEQVKEAADVDLIEQCIRDVLDEGGTIRDGAKHVAVAIRNMPYPGDSQ